MSRTTFAGSANAMSRIPFAVTAIVVLAALQGSPAVTQEATEPHPNMYLDAGEIAAIKAKVQASAQPWKAAYDRLISDANVALFQAPLSVTFQGPLPPSGDSHDYYTDPVYITDGVFNPAADRGDYIAAMSFGRAVRNLGLAYAFTDRSSYADKAIELIRAWCITASSRMSPRFPNFGSRIALCISMPGALYGADLMWNYAGWPVADKDAFARWVAALAANGKTWSSYQNFENWRLVLLSTAGALVGDAALRQYAFDRWKAILSNQMASDGHLVYETSRTKSLDYSTFALNAMVQTAEVARHYGVNLYAYTLSDGRGLEKTLDFHAPYLINPATWPYQQIAPYAGDNGDPALFELAYAWKQKSTYLGVINRWGRPMTNGWIMGPATLTHAFGAYPFDFGPDGVAPPPPPPTGGLPVAGVAASSYQFGNGPANTIDRELSTRWSAEGDGQWIRYDLGAIKSVGSVKIAWYLGNQRRAFFDLQLSPDATTWRTVFSGASTGTTLQLEAYDFADANARYVRIVGHGNTANSWNSITETAIVEGAGSSAPPTSNLAPNPGFESDPTVDYFTHGAGTFTWATDAAHGGSRSLKIVSSQPPGALARWLSKTYSLAAAPGTTYSASVWLKTSGVQQYGILTINFWGPNWVHLGGVSSSPVSGTTGWTWRSVQAVAPPGTVTVRLEFRLYGPGTLWVDDVVLSD